MIRIDGSHGEGGGQILRTALGLSAVLGADCRISNIRKGRKKPGLLRSHLATVKALKKMTSGQLEGAELGSTSIGFYPNRIREKKIEVKIKTAGSITLVLQGLLLPAVVNKKRVEIEFKGGATDTFFSPSLDHFRLVFLELLEKMGANIEIKVKRRGFYPRGKARLSVTVHPGSDLSPLFLTDRGNLKKVDIISGASKDLNNKRVAQRQISGAKGVLSKLKLPVKEKVRYWQAQSTGSAINIIARMENTVFGTDNLGKLGKSSEQVGKEAALDFLKEVRSRACLDKHTGDQILPYLPFASGKSKVSVSEITSHCRTNMWVVEKFLDGHFKTKDHLIVWRPNAEIGSGAAN